MRIVFFDLETGGLEDHHATIRIAAIAAESFDEIASFEAKIVFAPSHANEAALAINHYDPEVWSKDSKPESRRGATE